MTNANQQILTLAKQGFTAQEIADTTGDDVNSVIIILDQHKGAIKSKEDTNNAVKMIEDSFSEALPTLLLNMQSLALTCEDPMVRFRATSYALDTMMGLKKPAKGSVSNTFNIVQLSENIKKAKMSVNNRATECGIEPPANFSLVNI